MATSTYRRARRIDTAWFLDLIAASRFGSGRKLAPYIKGRSGRPLASSNLSLMLNGKRAMQLHEARQLATLLGVPLAEILRHAGIDVRDAGDDIEPRHRAAVRMVRTLLAFIDETGVHLPKKVRDAAEAIE